MSFKDDKIKVLVMISGSMMPSGVTQDDQEISFDENDFKREGFSYHEALMIFKDIFESDLIHSFKTTETDDGIRGVQISVNHDIDHYTRLLKYPDYENEYYASMADDMDIAKPTIPSKVPIVIDERKGIYILDNPEKRYKIQNPSARFAIVKYLFENDKVSISTLSKIANHKSSSLTIKEINRINDCFRKHLSLPVGHDLIVSIHTGGYSLNTDRFLIQPNS